MATIKTNKLDYKPGESVSITAAGFTSDATVIFELLNLGPDGILGTADDFSYKSWIVIDGSRLDSSSLAGTIGTTWRVPGTALDSTLLLTAREAGRDGMFGTADDIFAITTFKDAKPIGGGGTSNSSANLDQWATGAAPDFPDLSTDKWVNGNLNANQAHYSEDFYIPYRTVYSGLKTDTTYITTIQWDVTKSGKHALDYIGTFDQRYAVNEANETTPNPAQGVTKLATGAGTVETLDILKDADFDTEALHDQEAGEFTLYGNVTFVGYALPGADGAFGTADDIGFLLGANGVFGGGDDKIVIAGADKVIQYSDANAPPNPLWDSFSDVYTYTANSDPFTSATGSATRQVTVLFRFDGSGGDTSAVLAWGGHIASSVDWGAGNSAVTIPGSPYHTAIDTAIGISDSTGTVANLAGHQDRSLASSAVIPSPPEPPTGNPTVLLDDDTQAGGDLDNTDPGDDLNSAQTTGTLNHDYGLSGPGSTLLLNQLTVVQAGPDGLFDTVDDIAVTGFASSLNADGTLMTISQTQGGASVNVIQVSFSNTVDALYTVTLLNTIDHPTLNGQLTGDNTENNVQFTLGYRVTNRNAEFADGTFKINADDDIPDATVANATADTLVLDETRPVGTEEDGDSAPAGLASVTAEFADNFTSPADYGSDGAGSTGYTLALTGSDVLSGLFALDAADTSAGDGDGIGKGAQIVLNQSGNTVTGSVGLTNYFTISINNSTGVVTFAQSNNVWHANTGSDDDTSTLTLSNANLLQVVQTVTDVDGDSDTAAINLGTGVFQIEDDGPNATVANATADTLVLDETRPVGTEEDGDSAPAGLASVTAEFADNFTSPADYGSDGAGSTGYTLALTGSDVLSGLFALDAADTSAGDGDGIGKGSQIVLNQSGNTVTGSVGLTNYFTISINNSTGVVTFAQSNNVWHANAGSDDDTSTLTLATADLLQVVQTVTDVDGDSDTAAINLGTGVFQIEDDGPNATVANATADTLVLDETRPVGTEEDGDSAPAGLASVTAEFADNFTSPADYGSDGAGSTGYTLALTGSDVLSGLFALDAADTSAGDGDGIGKGAQIVLNQSGNTVTGSVGLTNYFTISINNSTGVVTFAQSNNVWHANTGSDDDTSTLTLSNANLLQVVQTVTDVDGDSDTAAINLGTGVFQIEDDGPNATVANATADTLVLDETRPVGTEEDGDSAPAGLASVTAEFADNFTSPADYGSDGAGSTGYTLALTGSDVLSGLFALDAADTSAGDGDGIGKGAQIVLNQSGNTVTGTFNGTTYFTISINTSTGVVTFAQSNNVWHAITGSDDDTSTLTLSNANLLQVVQTVTDVDGDSDTAAINLGTGVFQIEDDGPNATVANATADTLVLDETRPVGTEEDGDSAPAGLASVTAEFADNFTSPADYGSDGAGSTGYTLALTGSDVLSGLFALDAADTSAGDGDGIGKGSQIVLNQSGNTVTGSVGLTNYFTISINNSTGVVTFAQSNNVWHAITGSDDDTSTLTLSNANLLQVVQTVTDVDGDSDTAAINLGTGVFQIEDDGPNATVANATADTLVLDETRPVGTEEDGDSAPAGLASVTAEFADNFTSPADYGSDGAGSTGYTLALTGSDVLSGLFALDAADTSAGDGDGIGKGAQIVLNQSGNTVTGSVGLTNYFTISINNSTGVVTFAQSNNVWHAITGSDDDTSTLTLSNANLLQVVQTVTDVDGDSDTAAINLGTGVFQIEDDGPNATVANATADTLVLDETRPVGTEEDGDSAPAGLASVTAEFADNFTSPADYGSDGAGSTGYTLALTGSDVLSGLFALDAADTSAGDGDGIGKGAQIVLNQSGNTVTGSVGLTNYFTISINNSTGVVTFAQSNNVWHAITGSDDDTSTLTLSNANLLQVVQTVTDVDGDSDTAAINLGTGVFQIEDDGPNATVANATADTLVLDETRPVGTEEDGDSAPAGLASVTAEFADNFTSPADYGSDGAGSTGYTLALTGSDVLSGLFALDAADTSAGDGDGIGKGAQIVLNQSGNTVTGSVGLTNYFTISINNSTGVVTFAQSNNVWHAITSSDDDTSTLTLSNANLLQVVQTVTDVDGDSDTAAINLGTGVFQIEDDGPDATSISNIYGYNTNLPLNGIYDFDVGTDVVGNAAGNGVVLTTNGLTGTTANGRPITDAAVSWQAEDGNSVTFSFTFKYYAGPTSTTQETANGTVVFNKGTGIYTFDLVDPIGGQTTFSTSAPSSTANYDTVGNGSPEIVVLGYGGPPSTFFGVLSGQAASPPSDTNDLTAGGNLAYVAGETFASAEVGYVNVGTATLGVNSDTVQQGELLNYDFYPANPVVGAASPPQNPSAAINPNAARGYVDSLTITIDQITAGEDIAVLLKLYNSALNQFTTKLLIANAADDYQAGAGSFKIVSIGADDYDSANYQIYGVQVVTSTENLTGIGSALTGGSDVTLTAAGDNFADTSDNDVIKIIKIDVTTKTISNFDTDLNFVGALVDADGDSDGFNFNVHLEADTATLTGTSASDYLTGTSAANTMTGGAGNDVLDGKGGKDTMTGGGDPDIFKLGAFAESLLANFDVVTDYATGAGGDQIDAPTGVAAANLTSSVGTAASLSATDIGIALAGLAANSAAAFQVTGQAGHFIALNDGTAGFDAAQDSIIHLPNVAAIGVSDYVQVI